MNLYVHFEHHLVGTLNRNTDLVYSFTYEDSWIKSDKSFALSLAIPLSKKKI